MRAKLEKARGSVRLPFVLLWLFLAVCHLFFRMGTGDDAYYSTVLANEGLVQHLAAAYREWSARTLIEAVLLTLNWLPPLVWQLLNPVVITASAWALWRRADGRGEAKTAWAVCGFMLLYPWQVMDSAGWIATSTGFVWPLAAALAALVPAAELLRSRPVPRWWPATLPLLLYAGNMELLLILLLPLAACLFGYRLLRSRRLPRLLACQLGVLLADLAWILACPGTKNRFASEQAAWFPNFGMKSLWSRLELGASSAMQELVMDRNLIFFFFALALAWAVWLRYKNPFYRALSLLPCVASALLGMYGRYTVRLLPGLRFFTEAVQGEGSITLANVSTPAAYLPMLLLYAVLAACLLCLYLALGHSSTSAVCMLVVCCGVLSRTAMGFTPTVWASGIRTGYFMNLAFVFAAVCLLRSLWPVAPRRQKQVFGFLFLAYCLLSMYSIQEIRIASGYS